MPVFWPRAGAAALTPAEMAVETDERLDAATSAMSGAGDGEVPLRARVPAAAKEFVKAA